MNRTVVSNKYSNMKPLLALMCVCCMYVPARSQVTIDSVYTWAESNYPLIKRAQLIRQTESYNLSNIARGYLPQLNVTGQATYQSEVIQVPVPNLPIEPLSKDQYKFYADVSQPVYEGGRIKAQRDMQRATSEIDAASLQKDLYLLRDRLNQLFFGALLLQTQQEQATLLIEQLQRTKNRVDSAIKNGAAFRSDADQLQSEILLQQQRIYDLEAGVTSYLQMLEAFTGREIRSASVLKAPEDNNSWTSNGNNRPELTIFDLRNKLLRSQVSLLNSRIRPKLNLFGQGGYGKPGLNQLKNEFDWYYIGGVRLNWNFSALYTYRNERRIIELNEKENEVQRETFLFNNNLTLIQQDNEQLKTAKLIASDEEIIRLKGNIREAAKVKYENGVITLNDYLKEISAVSQANLNLELHKTQSLLNQYNRKFSSGY